jgi:hypothetical protein
VADRDLARESKRPRALGDHANLERAELTRVVQMDVHARAMAPGDAEDDVELPLRIPIDAGGIDAADQLGAALHGTIEELCGARTGDDPALGKGDDLDRDDVFQPASRRDDPVEVPQADLGVDVHVAADVQGPAAHRLAGQAFRLDVGRQPQLPAQAPLVVDAVEHRGPRLVRGPRQGQERLVEMHVGVDDAGQQDAVLPSTTSAPGTAVIPGPTREMTPPVASTSTAAPAMGRTFRMRRSPLMPRPVLAVSPSARCSVRGRRGCSWVEGS